MNLTPQTTYRTRSGGTATVYWLGNGAFVYCGEVNGQHASWTQDGRYLGAAHEHDNDIVSDEPVAQIRN